MGVDVQSVHTILRMLLRGTQDAVLTPIPQVRIWGSYLHLVWDILGALSCIFNELSSLSSLLTLSWPDPESQARHPKP